MEIFKFNNEEYYTLKDVYKNLCVTRNSVIKKIKRLENIGYILRIKNKRPSIYISKEGYDFLRKDRIKYLDIQINDKNNIGMKEYFIKLKEAIGHPELWDKYHHYEVSDTFYFRQGEVISIESRRNDKNI